MPSANDRENFKNLCTGEKGRGKSGRHRHYRGSAFHRIVTGFVIQGGDFTLGNGKGGESTFGNGGVPFDDENFDLKHDEPGLLSMANSGPDSNRSQFFITLRPLKHLNGKHVVFGRVQSGHDVIEEVMEMGSKDGTPMGKVVISDCGLVR